MISFRPGSTDAPVSPRVRLITASEAGRSRAQLQPWLTSVWQPPTWRVRKGLTPYRPERWSEDCGAQAGAPSVALTAALRAIDLAHQANLEKLS